MGDPSQQQPRASRLPAVVALLAGSILASRLLGYVREMVLAGQLGVSAAVDAYRAAFQIPDMLNHFLAGGALSIAFIPLYSRLRAQRGEAAAERLLGVVLGTSGALVVAATAGLWWWAEELVALQFPGFSPETRALTTRLTRIVMPAQIFFVTGGIVRAALMARGRFASQALAPLLYNGAIIVGGLAAGKAHGAEAFIWGALVGAALGALAVPWLEARLLARLRLCPRVALLDRDFLSYLTLAAPLMLGLSLLTVDEWFDRWFGNRLGEGVVAQLGYARILALAPVAAIGQALATAALPTLSRLFSEGRREELGRVILEVLRVGLGLGVLAAAGLAALSEPIVAVVYERGAFTSAQTERVAALLAVFAVAVPAWVVQQIAVRGFYARADMWRPMLLGTGVALAAVPLYLALGARHGAAGLAAAGAIAMSVNAVLTLLWGRHLHDAPRLGPLAATGLRALGIGVVAGSAAWWAQGRAEPALLRLAAGTAALAMLAPLGVWLAGDAPLRSALARALRGRKREAP